MHATTTAGLDTASTRERTLVRLLERAMGDRPPVACGFRFPSGLRVAFGDARPEFEVDVTDADGLSALMSMDELRICEAYMDGHLDFLGDLARAIGLRESLKMESVWITLWRRLQPLLIGKNQARTKWVQNHYDSDNIQLHFLDTAYNTYTPGLFESEDETLEAASERKHRAAFEGLGLKAGDRVLDIGFGWGSFLRYATRRGVHVTGLTLSKHQLAFVQQSLVDRENLPAKLIYTDFFAWEPEQRFDAISMLGVIEELADYDAVMSRIARWMKPGGRVYLDFMAATQDFVFPAFISKYIYQGGTSRVYLPKFVDAVTRSKFEIGAIHNDRRNYHLTTRHWYENYERNREAIRERFGERTYRMFRMYLAGMPLMLDHPTHLTTAFRVFLDLPTDRA